VHDDGRMEPGNADERGRGVVLVAEDDQKQAALIRLYLEREGHQVHLVADGRSALRAAHELRPDLVLLDVMMPELDGIEVCRYLRAQSDVAILVLTARSSESDLVTGLEAGADDYLTKPYSPRVLLARVRALMRRARSDAPAVLRIGALEVDPGRFEVRLKGQAIHMTAKEFAILEALAGRPGRALTRREIIESAFGWDTDVLERTVDVHVASLRRKLESHAGGAGLVETVYGRGYRVSDEAAE
jgi:DNA-binding response OmpR family regulator